MLDTALARQHRRAVVVAAALAVAVAAVVVTVDVADEGQRNGPLTGPDGVQAGLPPGGGDVYWGTTILVNEGEEDVILESVELLGADGGLRESERAFVWGPERTGTAGGSLIAYQEPIPPEWVELPRRDVQGHRMPPSRTPADSSELVFVFEVPDAVATADGVRVTYRYAGSTYVEDFSSRVVLCPGLDVDAWDQS